MIVGWCHKSRNNVKQDNSPKEELFSSFAISLLYFPLFLPCSLLSRLFYLYPYVVRFSWRHTIHTYFCSFFSGWVECYLYKNPIPFYSVCQIARVSERPLTCTPERLGQVSVLHKDLKAKDTDSRVLTLVNQVGVSRHFTGIDTDRVKETRARALIGS